MPPIVKWPERALAMAWRNNSLSLVVIADLAPQSSPDGQHVPELDVWGILWGRILTAPLDQASESLDVPLEHHVGLDALADLRVRNAHHARGHDGRMLLEHGLDLRGGDTVALVLDGVHGAVHEVEVAFGIHRHDVRRAIPGLCRRCERKPPRFLPAC
jgi:hypothetical protein